MAGHKIKIPEVFEKNFQWLFIETYLNVNSGRSLSQRLTPLKYQGNQTLRTFVLHAQAIYVAVSCHVKHQTYAIGLKICYFEIWNKNRGFQPPSHSPSDPHFLSFTNFPTNNVCPFPALKQSTTDEMNGVPGKRYFISYKLNMFLYPFYLFIIFFFAI